MSVITTEMMREWHVKADHAGNKSRDEYEAEIDRWLDSIKAEAWEEGAKAGLDTGLTIAENVHEHGGKLDLTTIPNAPTNPYRRLMAEFEGEK